MNTFKTIIFLTLLIFISTIVEASRTSLKVKKAKKLFKSFKSFMKGEGNPYKDALKGLHYIVDNIDEVGKEIFDHVDEDGNGTIDEMEGKEALDIACKDTLEKKEHCREHVKETAMEHATENGLDEDGFINTLYDVSNDAIEYIKQIGEDEYNIRVGIKGIRQMLNDPEVMNYLTGHLWNASDKNADGTIDLEEVQHSIENVFHIGEEDVDYVWEHLADSGVLDDEVVDKEEFGGIVYQYFHGITVKLEGHLHEIREEKEEKKEEKKEVKEVVEEVVEEEEEELITPIFLKKKSLKKRN